MTYVQCPVINDFSNQNIPLCNKFMQQLVAYGDKVGLIDEETGVSYTFAQIRKLSGSVAAVLSTRFGFKKGKVLANFMENRPEYAMLFIGAIATGGAVTGINQLYTPREVANQLLDSQASIIVTRSALSSTLDAALKLLPKDQIQFIFVFDDVGGFHVSSCGAKIVPFSQLFSSPTTDLSRVAIDPMEDVAFLPYSSGTTGTPKGVLLTHVNLNYYFTLHPTIFTPHPSDRYLVVLPFIHIAGFGCLLASIYAGAETIVMPHYGPVLFMETVHKFKITMVLVVPSVLVMLTKHPQADMFDLSSLKCILFGAAPAGKELIMSVLKKLPNLKFLIQLYGMTESGVLVGQPRLPPARLDYSSAGMPLEYVKLRVISIDGRQTLLPPNVDGEICVKCPTNMKGYLNRPEQTRETIDEEGWLHTGDLGHYDEGGSIFVTDRLKELIKYKGNQVAPAELEDLLLAHPAIQEAAVTGIPDPVDPDVGELPTAFVVLKSGHLPNHETASSIEKLVNAQVAPYKRLRGGVHFLEEIPKTASGKMQRRKLRELVEEEQLKAKL